jgi:hypothetical protein
MKNIFSCTCKITRVKWNQKTHYRENRKLLPAHVLGVIWCGCVYVCVGRWVYGCFDAMAVLKCLYSCMHVCVNIHICKSSQCVLEFCVCMHAGSVYVCEYV